MSATSSCPACSRPVAISDLERPQSFPFCSPRCRNGDLVAWMNGRYAVAGEELLGEDGYPSERRRDRDHP